MRDNPLIGLALVFIPFSLTSIGGGAATGGGTTAIWSPGDAGARPAFRGCFLRSGALADVMVLSPQP